MKKKIFLYPATLFISILFLINITACTTAPPNNIQNICSIFQQYPDWYWTAQKTQKRWGLPIHVLMAIVYQESRFNATAKPPREKLLWIIPWFRPTSAYGYSQAINHTWLVYKKETGHNGADRDAFSDAADFIGWYAHRAHVRAGINSENAYQVYLAYHEGIGGYQRKTYLQKKWLINVAHKVSYRSSVYRSQLLSCQADLPQKHWWDFWD